MKLPIWHEAAQAVARTETGVVTIDHDVTNALDHIRNHQPTQEPPMPATLADAIHQAILDAVDATVADIVDRYLTPQNLAHALADGLDALPAHGHALTDPSVTQPAPPDVAAGADPLAIPANRIGPPADMAQPGDADAPEVPDPAAQAAQ